MSKNLLRLLMIPLTITYFASIVLMNEVIGILLLVLSPFILFAIYKAGCVIFGPNLPKTSTRKASMSKKNKLRLSMIPATIIFLILAGYLVERDILVITVIGVVLIILSPFILFAIYRAGCIIIDPNLANTITIRGLIHLSVVCLVIIMFVNLLALSVNWPALTNPLVTTEQYRKATGTLILGFGGFCALGPLAIIFVVKGFKVAPSKPTADEPGVCQNCGRVMDATDECYQHKDKILCRWCFKKLNINSEQTT